MIDSKDNKTPDTEIADGSSDKPAGIPRARRRPAKNKKTKPLRLFLGLSFPLHEQLAPLHEALHTVAVDEPSLRISPAQNLHVTLKFLGTVKREQVAEIHALCAPICARYQPLELTSQGIGLFKNSLWVGVADDDQLAALADDLNEAARLLGVADDVKGFVPHVTVARFGKEARPKLTSLLEKFATTEWGKFGAQKCYLYQSETLQEGARYFILKGYPLVPHEAADNTHTESESD
ncbi:MAG: RNA 2',3'-cyclic phosphodiesterase [Pseudohongiellaceae bacterium]